MSDSDPPPLPIGDINIFDRFQPSLTGGNYWITVSHSVQSAGSQVNDETLQAVQEFVVSAPQFTLDPGEIISMHPPAAASGRFAEQLPHVVLREPALPWERSVNGEDPPVTPWLALIVLTEDEIVGPASSPTRTSSGTVDSLLAQGDGIYKPAAIREDDIDPASTCNFIQLPTSIFTSVMPRLSELPLLAHCRQSNIGDKAALGLDPDGFFSIVTANRFPAAPSAEAPATRNIVHLVSIEGLEPLLVDSPDFNGCTSVALVSLASWTFQCQGDLPLDFAALVEKFKGDETDDGNLVATRLALTLPQEASDAGGAGSDKEVAARLGRGFVPLAWRTRTGEDSFAWYRGPLAPVVTEPLVKSGPFLSADSAMAYQSEYGIFDLSLAAAWEAGRAAALADESFGGTLLDFRRRGHKLTDDLLHRLDNDHFPPQQIAGLASDTSVEDTFLALLEAGLVGTIAPAATPPPPPDSPPPPPPPPPADPQAELAAFLADDGVRQRIRELVADDLDDIAGWLARLQLLYPLPFNLMVPDDSMLPPESLRFFYVDQNWTSALLDGAMSLGLESSRHTFYHDITHELVRDAAQQAAGALRASITGVDPPAAEAQANVITGLLIRSSLVSGWPTLAVRPYLDPDPAAPTLLRTLRMDHLSPTVLLCLFWGVPTVVEISEPQEGLQIGVDDDGKVALRNLVPSATPLGAQIGDLVQVYDHTGEQQLCARAPGSRTLDMAALAAALEAGLAGAGAMPAGDLTAAGLALQMMRSPEAIRFASDTA